MHRLNYSLLYNFKKITSMYFIISQVYNFTFCNFYALIKIFLFILTVIKRIASSYASHGSTLVIVIVCSTSSKKKKTSCHHFLVKILTTIGIWKVCCIWYPKQSLSLSHTWYIFRVVEYGERVHSRTAIWYARSTQTR